MSLCSQCQLLDFRFAGYYRPENYSTRPVATDDETKIDSEDDVRSHESTTPAEDNNETKEINHETSERKRESGEELMTESETESEGSSFQGLSDNKERSLREVLDHKDACFFCNQISSLLNTWTKRFWPDPTEQDIKTGKVSFSAEMFGVIDASTHTRHDDDLHMASVSVSFNRRQYGASMQFQRTREYPPSVTEICDLLEPSSGENEQESTSVWLDLEPYYGRIRPPEVDFRLLREWKRICDNGHEDSCGIASIHTKRRPGMVRCIDVDAMCIVELRDPGAKWVALSYVWGKRAFKVLKEDLLEALRCPGALESSWIPDTILDAIYVTRMIGEKYLWTDSLCIIQDSPRDKATFIPLMDVIYGLATLTIVALSGESAYDGLPGVRPSSRPSAEGSFCLNGVWLQKAPPLDGLGFEQADQSRSRYMSRAWTLQEILLSRRLLIFTPEVVFWECQSATWREDSNWEILSPDERGITLFRNRLFNFGHQGIYVPKADPETFNRMYQSLVSDYGRRELTYDGDGLAAIEGILASVELTSGIGFTWALPKPFFGVAITWPTAHNGSLVSRRKAKYTMVTGQGTIQVPYPSWSWVGWIGPNLFDDLFGHLAGEHAGLEFYMLDGEKDQLILIEQNQQFIGTKTNDWPHRRARSIWRENAFLAVCIKDVPNSLLAPDLRPSLLIFWTSCCTLFSKPGAENLSENQHQKKQDEQREQTEEEYQEKLTKDLSKDQVLDDHRGNNIGVIWGHYLSNINTAFGEAEFIIVGRSSLDWARSRSELVAYMVEKQPSGARTRVMSATVAEDEWNALVDRRWELVFLL
ncbi:tol protein-like protein [Colletotrichum asianum]|uniref:Tol protein-like protein n=1 Tax=Colletotrichum asianum TaxID=702518 RepID=A0A8H3WLI9_9PEZI|nr:tol protein-like protein [Colletotrichum asianum]